MNTAWIPLMNTAGFHPMHADFRQNAIGWIFTAFMHQLGGIDIHALSDKYLNSSCTCKQLPYMQD